jgi:hypothetical protein
MTTNGTHRLRTRILALATAIVLVNGCLASSLPEPAQPSTFGDGIAATLVAGKVVFEKELAEGGIGPSELNKALRQALHESQLFERVVFERDVPTTGVKGDGPTYLVKWRIVDVDVDSSNPGLYAIVGLSLTVVPLFFVGLARTSVTQTLEIRMKVYDVTSAALERVKDEGMAEYFNAYDVSSLTPMVTRTYSVTTDYALGSDDDEGRDQLWADVADDLSNRLLAEAGPDIRRAAGPTDAPATETVTAEKSPSADSIGGEADPTATAAVPAPTPEPPKGLAGFYFGLAREDAERACTEAGHEATAIDKGLLCSGTAANVGFESETYLVMRDGKLDRIVVHEELSSSPTAVAKRYAELKKVLQTKYGRPTDNDIEIDHRCKDVDACIKAKKVSMRTSWTLANGMRLYLRLEKGPMLRLDYRAARCSGQAPHPRRHAPCV